MLPEIKTLENSLKQILYSCVEHVHATKAALYLSSSHDLNEKTYEIITSYQYTPANRKTLTANDDLVDRLAVKRSTFFVNGVGSDQRFAEMLFQQGNDRLLAAPIFSRGRLVGFIDMRDKAGKKPFEPVDVNAANHIAEQVTQLLATQRLFGLGAIPLSDDVPKQQSEPSAAPGLAMMPKPAAKPGEPATPLSADAMKIIHAARQVLSKRQLAPSDRKRILSADDLEIPRLLLPAALAIPDVIVACFTAIGHANHLQAIASRTSLNGPVLERLMSHLRDWRTQQNLSALPPTQPQITYPFGGELGSIGTESVNIFRSAAVSAHSVDGLVLTIGFEKAPPPESQRALQALLRQFEQAIDAAIVSTSGRTDKQAIAESLLEPDFQKHPDLADHCKRVASVAQRFAQAINLPDAQVEIVRLAALVHDVGLRLLDYDRMYKRLSLTPEEMRGLAEHPLVGAAIVEPLLGPEVAQAVLRHHERVDGKGYPSRLSGQQIPLASRIVQIADAWVAMTSTQSYQTAVSHDEAMRRLRQGAGAQFDRELVAKFLEKHDDIVN